MLTGVSTQIHSPSSVDCARLHLSHTIKYSTSNMTPKSEHSNDGIIPEIPGELLVKMFIHKVEKEALGIDQNATETCRMDNQIPYSDRFAMIMPRDKRSIGTQRTSIRTSGVKCTNREYI